MRLVIRGILRDTTAVAHAGCCILILVERLRDAVWAAIMQLKNGKSFLKKE
jgi:hypothetical protein